jgi:hypothetical protein
MEELLTKLHKLAVPILLILTLILKIKLMEDLKLPMETMELESISNNYVQLFIY